MFLRSLVFASVLLFGSLASAQSYVMTYDTLGAPMWTLLAGSVSEPTPATNDCPHCVAAPVVVSHAPAVYQSVVAPSTGHARVIQKTSVRQAWRPVWLRRATFSPVRRTRTRTVTSSCTSCF